MLSTLLILAALAQPSKAEAELPPPKCPLCPPTTAPTIVSQCGGYCHCPFPGACLHPGCDCKPIAGLRRPPADEWRVFTANPAWEVYGHEWNGVFLYTHRRQRKEIWVPQMPATRGS